MGIGEAIHAVQLQRNELSSQTAPLASTAGTDQMPISLPPRDPHHRELPAETDISLLERDNARDATKAKFSDIYEVHGNCEKFPVDLPSYSDSENVKGRLNLPSSIRFFEEIGASEFVLNTLRNGHFPSLKCPVPDYEIENHGSFRKHYSFAIDNLRSLLEKGRIEIVDKKPKLVNPLHVVEQRLKNRLILDCSKLNKFIVVPKIKYDNHEVAFQYFRKGIYMFNYDLKDGYHHLLIHPSFRDYLGFKLEWEGKMTYFRYVVGCFGLADLPFIYTKIYRPLVAHWRSFGIPAIKFLDDGGFFVKDRQTALEYRDHVRKDLIRSGSIYSNKKCVWEPTQIMTWLGFTWNSENGTVSAAPHRVETRPYTRQNQSRAIGQEQ